MDILVNLDHNYLMPTSVMLKSLATNNNDVDIICHAIIDNTVTQDDKQVLLSSFADAKKRQIMFYAVSYDELPNLPLSSNHSFTTSAYFRLFSASLLPPSVEKVIYIDGDALVLDDISNLWAIDLKEEAVAGVLDCNQQPTHYNRLKIESKKGYINGGVLLINLKYWREHNSEYLFRQYLERTIPEYADQDVINFVFQDKKMILPLQYNLTRAYYYKPQFAPFFYYDIKEKLEYARVHPVIVHFTGEDKPWYKDCLHPMTSEFLKYYGMTAWKEVALKKKPFDLKRIVKSFLWKMGVISTDVTINKFVDEYLPISYKTMRSCQKNC